MSAFSGSRQYMATDWDSYGPGAMRRHRERKRLDADERNAKTLPERRAQFRRDRARVQAAIADAHPERSTS